MKAIGTKMITSEIVVATTASVISRVASMAAVFGSSYFSSMKRTMFSRTTIASSMTMPTANVRPSSVMLFSVKFIALSSVNVAMIDGGIDEDRLVRNDLGVDTRRQTLTDLIEFAFHEIDDCNRICARLAANIKL